MFFEYFGSAAEVAAEGLVDCPVLQVQLKVCVSESGVLDLSTGLWRLYHATKQINIVSIITYEIIDLLKAAPKRPQPSSELTAD